MYVFENVFPGVCVLRCFLPLWLAKQEESAPLYGQDYLQSRQLCVIAAQFAIWDWKQSACSFVTLCGFCLLYLICDLGLTHRFCLLVLIISGCDNFCYCFPFCLLLGCNCGPLYLLQDTLSWVLHLLSLCFMFRVSFVYWWILLVNPWCLCYYWYLILWLFCLGLTKL